MAPATVAHQGQGTSRRALLLALTGASLGLASAARTTKSAGLTQAAASPTAPSTTQDATPTVSAASAFLNTLIESERDAMLFDWTDTAQKQRWSNLPQGIFERAGLMWGDLSAPAQEAWLALMRATLSAAGYARVIGQWHADDALAQEGGGGGGGQQLMFGTQYYWIALIGPPSETEPWQWQFGGHHVTINATIVGPDISLTPSFIGVQPATYTNANGDTVRPLGDIEDDAFALINLLDATQQQFAILGDTPIDLVLGPGQDGKTLQPEGYPASEMAANQRAALLKLISHYAGLANDEDAAARLAEIESTLDETYLAWYGPTTPGSAAYFRVTGPTLVIEYSPQGDSPLQWRGAWGGEVPGSATADTQHIHGIYRDPTNDYGAKYTGITIGE